VISIYSVIALFLAVIFAVIGVVQLAGPEFVRDTYRLWHYPRRVRLVTGTLDLVTAVLLVVPSLRLWGIGLGALLTFGAVVVFLAHRQYRYASLAMVLMAALIPATLAVPRPGPLQIKEAAETAETNTAVD
jgi:hypothetical protein